MNTLPQSIEQAAQAAAKDFCVNDQWARQESDYDRDRRHVEEGWRQCFAHLLSGQPEFDETAALERAKQNWPHAQMAAQVAALRAHLDRERDIWHDLHNDQSGVVATLKAKHAVELERLRAELAAWKAEALKLKAALEETSRYLEGIRSGRELGTDASQCGERAKRYAQQIMVEIDARLSDFAAFEKGGGK